MIRVRARHVVRQLRRALVIPGLHPGGRTPGGMFGRCERLTLRAAAIV
jgi:hypothetical protein